MQQEKPRIQFPSSSQNTPPLPTAPRLPKEEPCVQLYPSFFRFFPSNTFLHIADWSSNISSTLGVFHPSLNDFSCNVVRVGFILEDKGIPSLPDGPNSKQKDTIPRHGRLTKFPPYLSIFGKPIMHISLEEEVVLSRSLQVRSHRSD